MAALTAAGTSLSDKMGLLTVADPRDVARSPSPEPLNLGSVWVHIPPHSHTIRSRTASEDQLSPAASFLDSNAASAVGSPSVTPKRKQRKGPHLKLPSIASPASTSVRAPDSPGSDDHSATQLTNREYVSPPAIELPKGNYLTELKEEDLEIVHELGAGNGGVVQKVLHKPTNKLMARKLIHVESKAKIRKQIIRELKILHDCHHPNIIDFYGAFHRDTDISICMEYMDMGSLETLMRKAGPLPENVVARICFAMLSGLVYLYEDLHIIHRDVKPSNTLVNSAGVVKLCDFGVAGMTINSVADTFVGTSNYMSPERIQGSQYTTRSDVWSLGIMAIELALGHHPFPTSADGQIPILELLQYIVNEEPPALPESFSAEFRDFTAQCLKKEEAKRSSPKVLLGHPFIVANGGDGKLDPEWLKRVVSQPQ